MSCGESHAGLTDLRLELPQPQLQLANLTLIHLRPDAQVRLSQFYREFIPNIVKFGKMTSGNGGHRPGPRHPTIYKKTPTEIPDFHVLFLRTGVLGFGGTICPYKSLTCWGNFLHSANASLSEARNSRLSFPDNRLTDMIGRLTALGSLNASTCSMTCFIFII